MCKQSYIFLLGPVYSTQSQNVLRSNLRQRSNLICQPQFHFLFYPQTQDISFNDQTGSFCPSAPSGSFLGVCRLISRGRLPDATTWLQLRKKGGVSIL